MSREGVLLDNFSGGLNNVTDPSLIDDNELAQAVNVVLTRNGKLISRPPFTIQTAKPSGATYLRPLGYFRNQDGLVQLVAATQNKTYLYNFATNTWTEIWSSAAADIATYYNRLYLVSTSTAGGYWSKIGSTYTFTVVAAMPKGNQIHYTKGRIYISSRETGKTSSLRYSNIPSASGDSIDQFPVDNVIEVNEGDGELLLKIIEGNSELFLFRSNSTWRLAFGASAEPTDGTLTIMSNIIGADNEFSVVEGENYHAVMHAGTLYRFAGYNFFPINDYNKVQFSAQPGSWLIGSAVSKVGQYLVAWYYGSTYCFDTESNAWTEWDSTRKPVYFLEAPRGTFAAANEATVGYGVGALSAEQSLLRFALEYDGSATETIECKIKTRTYDAGMPTKFKRMFAWELLTVAVNSITGGIVSVEETGQTLSWTTLQTYTWAQAQANGYVWSPAGTSIPVTIGGLPAVVGPPRVVKISGKQTFRRAYFTVEFANDGTASTAPSRLDGIVLYLTSGRKSTSERVS
jgi:hypothetical protein